MKKAIINSLSIILLTAIASTSFAGPGHWRHNRRHRRGRTRVYVTGVYYPRQDYYSSPTSYATYGPYKTPGPVYTANINPFGPYVSINLGAGFVNDTNLGANVASGGESGFAYGLDFGANLTQNLAVEAGAMRLPDVVKNNDNNNEQTLSTNNYYIDLAVKASVLLSNSSSLFVKLGVANAGTQLVKNNISKTIHQGAPLFGIGLQLQATPNLGLLVEYTGTTQVGNSFATGVPAMSAVSFGVVGNV